MKDRVETTCSCCGTQLTVDVETGEILAEQRPKQDPGKTFEDAMHKVQSGQQKREEAFSKAFQRTQKLDDVLGKKFDEARKKAAKDPSRPFNPFDAD